jgi:hypothetical protein
VRGGLITSRLSDSGQLLGSEQGCDRKDNVISQLMRLSHTGYILLRASWFGDCSRNNSDGERSRNNSDGERSRNNSDGDRSRDNSDGDHSRNNSDGDISRVVEITDFISLENH